MAERPLRRARIGVALGLAALLLVGAVLVDRRITNMQIQDASDELFLLMTLRRGALESYFDTVRAELTFWSASDALRHGLVALREGWDANPGGAQRLQTAYIDENPFPPDRRRELEAVEDGSAYSAAHLATHPLARAFVSERGYYDFFLIDPAGHVIYSVEKESDFASDLTGEAWRESGLAEVYRRASDPDEPGSVVFTDFARYGPSHDEPALFGGVAVRGPDGALLGILALQVPTERIQSIMQFTAGMGETGETYLVGSDLRMRSDSRFSDESTTLETRVESHAVRRALAQETGVEFTDDYRGVPVLSAYGSFSLEGFDWAVLAEIDRDEVFESVSDLRLSVPALGLAFYALAMVSLWLFDPSGWGGGNLDAFDLGDLGDMGDSPAP